MRGRAATAAAAAASHAATLLSAASPSLSAARTARPSQLAIRAATAAICSAVSSQLAITASAITTATYPTLPVTFTLRTTEPNSLTTAARTSTLHPSIRARRLALPLTASARLPTTTRSSVCTATS